MQVVPNVPGTEATGSERRVLSLLRSIDWGGASSRALSSLNVAEHVYQRWGEIDFLLVGEKGLIAIEVKGGDVSCSRGRWRYEDRMGRVVVRSKSPVVQAKDAFFSLDRNYVSPHLGDGFCASVPAGFCVILAGIARRDLTALLGGPEFPPELIGTRDDLSTPAALQGFLERVARYWASKNATYKRILDRDVKALVSLLRPEFETVHPLRLVHDRLEGEMISLTEEQYSILDHWEGAERIFCSSPAGCGKTLLAVEMLRRMAAEGVNACLLVGSSSLAADLRSHRRGLSELIIAIDEVEALSDEARPKVSVLLIDEGQQILSEARLAITNEMVDGGFATGRWAWFGDISYQAPESSQYVFPAASKLASLATVRPKLTKNCRNTPEIILATELAAGVPLGHALVSGRGLHPKMVSAADSTSLDQLLAEQVARWQAEDIPLSSITVLTSGPDAEEIVHSASRTGGFVAKAWRAGVGVRDAISYTTIDAFRGLESGFVILCMTGECPEDVELGRRLYLGMTRGNFALSVVASAPTLEKIQARMAKNAETHLMGVPANGS